MTRREAARRGGLPDVPGRAGHARDGGPLRLPPGRSRRHAGRAGDRRQRRRPRPAARVLPLPEPQVLAKIMQTWRRDRKPANVMLVFDNSGSMGDEDKLEQAKEGLKAFFRQAAPQDEIGLTKFSAEVTPLVSPAPLRDQPGRAARRRPTTSSPRTTRVYDATSRRAGGRGRAGPASHQRRRGAHRRRGHDLLEQRRRASPRARAGAAQGIRRRARVHHRLRPRRPRQTSSPRSRWPRAARLQGAPTTSSRSTGRSLLLLSQRARRPAARCSARSPSTRPPSRSTCSRPAGVIVAGLLSARVAGAGGRSSLTRAVPADVLRRARGGRPSASGSASPGCARVRACRRSSRRSPPRREPRWPPAPRSGASVRARSRCARSTRTSTRCGRPRSGPAHPRLAPDRPGARRAERLQARLDQLLEGIGQVVVTLETVQAEILVADGVELIADQAGPGAELRVEVQPAA